ncbi:MAG: SemiSWEET transporter [Smithellaceae bacterium]|nr:SemiSWEET transporter [Smithellaceae bacterium]
MENYVNIIGLIAAGLTTFAMLPQVIKIHRTRNTKDLSLYTFALFCSGVCCWLIYGILIGSQPLIMGNGISLGFASYILAMKIIHG